MAQGPPPPVELEMALRTAVQAETWKRRRVSQIVLNFKVEHN